MAVLLAAATPTATIALSTATDVLEKTANNVVPPPQVPIGPKSSLVRMDATVPVTVNVRAIEPAVNTGVTLQPIESTFAPHLEVQQEAIATPTIAAMDVTMSTPAQPTASAPEAKPAVDTTVTTTTSTTAQVETSPAMVTSPTTEAVLTVV